MEQPISQDQEHVPDPPDFPQKNDHRSLLRYRGAVGFGDEVLTSELAAHLAACLRNAGAWEVTVRGDRVVFTGSGMGAVFSFKWPVLAPFGCGELEVDSACRQVRYSLRLRDGCFSGWLEECQRS